MLNVYTNLPWFALQAIGNNRQPSKPLYELTKTSFTVKIWEQFNQMGAIIYTRQFIGSLFELS